MQPSDLGAYRSVTSVALSPDGRTLAYVVGGIDLPANRYRSRIWIAPTDGSEPPRPLTAGDHADGVPTWSPDGRLLAFTSEQPGEELRVSVRMLAVDRAGEAITLTGDTETAGNLRWSPDGRWLAFVRRAPTADARITDLRARPPRRIGRFYARLDNEGWTIDRPRHLWVVPTDASLAARDLTPGEHEFDGADWLPDSTGLVCAAATHDTWDLDLQSHLHLVPLHGEPRPLTTGAIRVGDPCVSPDGTQVAFTGGEDPDVDPQNGRLGLLDLATGERRWLDTGLDRTWSPYPSPGRPRWADDGHLVAAVEDRGGVHLYLVPVAGGAIEPLVAGSRAVAAFDAAGGVLALAAGTAHEPNEAFVVRAGLERRVSEATASFRAQARPIAPVSLTAGDHEIDVWVFLPEGYDASGTARYPMLVNIHGGPFTQFGHRFFDEAQVQAGAGYVVVLSNPRGGSGRETAWGRAIAGAKSRILPGTGWGSVDADDIHTVVDTVLARYPAIDPARIGVIGGSYGGYLTSWLVGHSDRFAAAVSERSVNNMLTLEWTSDIATAFRTELGVTHLDDPQEYLRMSPISYVRDMNTPVLILHSEDDLRCPISQAEELFVALRLLGKPVEFLRFPGEGHELTRSGSPCHRVQRFEAILEYFGRHL